MKRYTDDELLKMSEEKLNKLLNEEKIDDDDWQRWHDIRMEMDEIAERFFADLKAITREHPLF